MSEHLKRSHKGGIRKTYGRYTEDTDIWKTYGRHTEDVQKECLIEKAYQRHTPYPIPQAFRRHTDGIQKHTKDIQNTYGRHTEYIPKSKDIRTACRTVTYY